MTKTEKLTEKKNITKSEYYALVGIKELSNRYDKILKELVIEVQKITGEINVLGLPATSDAYSGHCSDFVYGSRELDDMLRIMELSVGDKNGWIIKQKERPIFGYNLDESVFSLVPDDWTIFETQDAAEEIILDMGFGDTVIITSSNE